MATSKELTNKEVYDLKETLSACVGYPGLDFATSISRNLKIVNEEISHLEKGLKKKEWQEYLNKKHELYQKYNKRDAGGEIVLAEGNRYDIADKEGLDKELAELFENNKSFVEEKLKIDNEFSKLQDKKSKVLISSLHKIPYSSIPKNILTAHYVSLDEFYLIDQNK